ncbi:MAG: hypothetical protein FWD61_13660 [Phycisphaerales bacterium]|nr:hypothetical protein [Phycisphaerales bacterium]
MMIRSILHYIILSLCLVLAIYVVAKRRNIIPNGIWRHSWMEPSIGRYDFSIGINDFAGFTFFWTYHLPTPRPWPATRPARPGVYEGNEWAYSLHNWHGFTYAVIGSAAAARMPITKVATIYVIPWQCLLTLLLLYPAVYLLTRFRRRPKSAHGFPVILSPTPAREAACKPAG